MIPALDSSVYVIEMEEGPIKIGISNNVASRLATLQTAQPSTLSVRYVVRMSLAAARSVEALAHKRLKRHRLRGEWFDVDPAAAIAAVSEAHSEYLDRGSKDGLRQLETLGWVIGPAMEAGLAYRELREVASRAEPVTRGERLGGSIPRTVDARAKLRKIDAEVLGRCGRAPYALMISVAAKGRVVDTFADTEDAWEKVAGAVAQTLDVVAEFFDNPIRA